MGNIQVTVILEVISPNYLNGTITYSIQTFLYEISFQTYIILSLEYWAYEGRIILTMEVEHLKISRTFL